MERKRLQVDLSPGAVQELQELQDKTGLSSRADLIRYALRFLQWTVDELETEGAHLLLSKNGEIHRIALPFWPANRKHSRKEEATPREDESVDTGQAIDTGPALVQE